MPLLEKQTALDDRLNAFFLRMGLAPQQSTSGHHLLRYQSTAIMVSTFSSGERVYCRIASVVLHQVEPTLPFLQQLHRLNTQTLFGAFLLFEDGLLSFSATLIADGLTFETFEHAVHYVAALSAKFDVDFQLIGDGLRAEQLFNSKSS